MCKLRRSTNKGYIFVPSPLHSISISLSVCVCLFYTKMMIFIPYFSRRSFECFYFVCACRFFQKERISHSKRKERDITWDITTQSDLCIYIHKTHIEHAVWVLRLSFLRIFDPFTHIFW